MTGIQPPQNKRELAILGFGPSAIERRWDILRYIGGREIWTLNDYYNRFAHIEGELARIFELHSAEYLRAYNPPGVANHLARLSASGRPVFTSETQPFLERQVVVDWLKVFRHFCLGRGNAVNYFLGSPSLMMALAVYEHDTGRPIRSIHSWGIDTSDERHRQQRAAWAYWVAQGQARGIEFGGSALSFMAEPDIDAGIAGLRERVGDTLEQEMTGGAAPAADRSAAPPTESAGAGEPAARVA